MVSTRSAVHWSGKQHAARITVTEVHEHTTLQTKIMCNNDSIVVKLNYPYKPIRKDDRQ